MKTQYLLISTLLAISVLLPSCVKQPDIPDTTTDIEGTVTNATTGDSMPNYNVYLARAPIADIYSTASTDDTIVATDAKGHYKIVKKLVYYKTCAYMINAEPTQEYAPTTNGLEVTVGIKNIFNFKIKRQSDYSVTDGVITDLQNNKLINIKVILYEIYKPTNELIETNETISDSLGKFHFEFQFSAYDSTLSKYKVTVPQTNKYQSSADYWVKWGVDNYFNIVLQPLN